MSAERSETQRMWIEGSTLGVGVVLAVVLFGMVNYLSLRHYKRFDWTSSRLYSLSEKSEKVLAALDREIEAVIVIPPASELYGPAEELLTRYAAANPGFFKKRAIDLAANRLEASRLVEQYNIERSNVIVIATENDRRIIDGDDLAEYDYSGMQMGQGRTLKEFKGEQMITSAILELVEAKKPKILLTTGHGEANPALNSAKIFLGRDNFEFEEWSPLGESRVPEDADLVVMARPANQLLQSELDLFTSYLEGGGRLLLLLDPLDDQGLASDPLLRDWLATYGVELGDNLLIDPAAQLPLQGAETLYALSYGFHPIVENLDKAEKPVLLSSVRSVAKAADAPGEYEITELVKTTDEAWGETDLRSLEPDEGEVQGAVSTGVAISWKTAAAEESEDSEKTEESDTEASDTDEPDADVDAAPSADDGDAPEARLVVFGDVDFATDNFIETMSNSELLVNTFNWLVEREQLIAIEGRKPADTQLAMNPSQYSSIYVLIKLILPGFGILAGIWVYLRRRR